MSLTRGSLPAGVYWRRRALVLGSAVLLVFTVVRGVGGGGEVSGEGQAARVAAEPTAPPGVREIKKPKVKKAESRRDDPTDKDPEDQPTETMPPLAIPEGYCVDGDIAVTPSVEDAVAGRDVAIVLQLRTLSVEACTWRVSPAHVALKVTSGDDDIWSSRECPGAIAAQEVTVRRDVTSTIDVVWNAKRSDPRCSGFTEWALPGFYHVVAAALGGEPSNVQFELDEPKAKVVTETVTAEPEQGKGKGKGTGRDKGRSGQGEPDGGKAKPDGGKAKPDGAQEPDEPKPEKPRRQR